MYVCCFAIVEFNCQFDFYLWVRVYYKFNGFKSYVVNYIHSKFSKVYNTYLSKKLQIKTVCIYAQAGALFRTVLSSLLKLICFNKIKFPDLVHNFFL